MTPGRKSAKKTREQAFAAIDAIRERNADKDPDEVLRDVTEIVGEVRQERYEQRERIASKNRRGKEING